MYQQVYTMMLSTALFLIVLWGILWLSGVLGQSIPVPATSPPLSMEVQSNILIVYDLLSLVDSNQQNISEIQREILCRANESPKTGASRVLFVHNYYECDNFFIQSGPLDHEQLIANGVRVSYFAHKDDIFLRCPYSNNEVDTHVYSFQQFFNRVELGQPDNPFTMIFRLNSVYLLYTSSMFNVVFIKFDGDIPNWEAWLNNILTIYKANTKKPTYAIILGDLSSNITLFQREFLDEIINSGQVLAIIETDYQVNATSDTRDAWKNIIWISLKEGGETTNFFYNIFIENVNITHFNLVVNSRKYAFYTDPLKKRTCNYPLCYFDCEEAQLYKGYCISTLSPLFYTNHVEKVHRHWAIEYAPDDVAQLPWLQSTAYKVPIVQRTRVGASAATRTTTTTPNPIYRESVFDDEYKYFVREKRKPRWTRNSRWCSYRPKSRQRRQLADYTVTPMPDLLDSYTDEIKSLLPYPDWFNYWLDTVYEKKSFNLLLNEYTDTMILIQSPSRYAIVRQESAEYMIVPQGYVQLSMKIDKQTVSLSYLAKCYHGIVSTEISEQPAQCLRYNIYRLRYNDDNNYTVYDLACKRNTSETDIEQTTPITGSTEITTAIDEQNITPATGTVKVNPLEADDASSTIATTTTTTTLPPQTTTTKKAQTKKNKN